MTSRSTEEVEEIEKSEKYGLDRDFDMEELQEC